MVDNDNNTNVLLEKSRKAFEGKKCQAHNDPHMKTFDGLHKSYPMEVQIQVTPCNGGNVRCTCGLAVRAGGDVFVINRCSERTMFDFRSCSDGMLEVTKKNEYDYKASFVV
ncbi:hypothetical protein KUTeg_019219 [Tegillarca granosa]|uniref:Uncharacterized protein n=1 Tax=Tegillarca granosa TaxID=220873 RepID=A0ABQ9EBW4_TEGGR|nr:hypothetical protein KUTeg_019219 [Tegillarca granosa]